LKGCSTNDKILAQSSTNLAQTKALGLNPKFKSGGAREMHLLDKIILVNEVIDY